MINHPLGIFLVIIFWGKLSSKLISKVKEFVKNEKPKIEPKKKEAESPLRKEIIEKETKISQMNEELTKLLKEAEKVNSPQTFALYSKLQRKSNVLKEKIEESEKELEKSKTENENLKVEKNPEVEKHKNQKEEDNSFLDFEKKGKIIEVLLQIVRILKKNQIYLKFY